LEWINTKRDGHRGQDGGAATHTRRLGSRGRRRLETRLWLLSGAGVLIAAVCIAVIVGTNFSTQHLPPKREHPDLPGIDVAGLDTNYLGLLLTESKKQSCPCSCGFTLADCRHKDPTCPRSGPILNGMVKDYRERQANRGEGE
jgi:hypothetical protein